MRKLKILTSGPTGSGTTAIVSALVRHFDLPVRAEDLRDICSARNAYQPLKKLPPDSQQAIGAAYAAWANSFVGLDSLSV